MSQNLRARLARIRETRQQVDEKQQQSSLNCSAGDTGKMINLHSNLDRQKCQWQEAGCKVLRRTLVLPFALPAALPENLPWLIPDLFRNQMDDDILPDPDRFLFFDLETTGLSGGAGTVAFLAAFGRSISGENLEVTQFLLLDYPGETDFLEQILSFILPPGPHNPPFLTTYNGKAFDTQILKTRCLMNGLAFPPFFQVDLLHPARRLWKRILPNCSQATIETLVLGLDRTGDTPGSMAPDIWFNFLRTGGNFTGTGQDDEAEQESCRALKGICDHNVKDIFGLASVFKAFIETAAFPLDAAVRFNCDEENLALCWRHNYRAGQEKTAALLLEAAAENYPRACLRLGFVRFRQDRYEEGRTVLKRIVQPGTRWKVPCPVTVQALALRSLAIDAERRLEHRDLARSYIEKAVSLPQLPKRLQEDLEKRQNRILQALD